MLVCPTLVGDLRAVREEEVAGASVASVWVLAVLAPGLKLAPDLAEVGGTRDEVGLLTTP